ncbi:MAG: right-handed parallel beta-helix repeat-containing protein [Verrucomicrobia bacterium]|nr:right-handed parallel beta-helix repeat-containing protein [Verrucomicrobiota bacterium]
MKTSPMAFRRGRPNSHTGKCRSIWVISLASLAATGLSQAASAPGTSTPLSGAQSGTLTLANSPYLATADIYVSGNQTLTIEPGVVVQFQAPDVGFFVDGTLLARGTAAAPILFTSDDAQKAPGQWEAIIFRGANTNSILENCTVEYGAAAGFADEIIRCESASPTIRNCTIRGSRFHGIRLFSSDPRLENCQFTGNGAANKDAFALFMHVNSLPQLRNNTATGNAHDAIGVFDYHFARNGTWMKDNLPYTLLDDVYVDAGKTLSVEPGVVVQFQNPFAALIVDGTFIARATATAPIVFTSDDAQKAPGQWEAIIFRASNTNSILENCTVEYGAAAGQSDESIRFETATATLRNCTIRNSRLHGIKLLGSDPLIETCRFLNNGQTNKEAFAIFMRLDSLPLLKNNTASGNGQDAIGIFDYHFARNGAWLKDNLPYTLLDDVYVDAGKTLTIAPEVIVQFQNPYSALIVDGTLIARATATTPIVFTSDDAQKAPGQWEAIIFRSSNTNSILENCIVEYGAAAGQSDENIRFENATATIRNCTIRNSRMHGLKLLGSDPLLDNCRFLNNGSTNKGAFAISMRVDSLPLLKNNTATGNVQDAIGVFDYHFARNGAWLKDNLPYTLPDDVYVDAGKTLTIEPGVIVQFQNPYATFIVDGTLVARGTPTAPILFTSDKAQKAPGQWEALVFRASNTNSILENCLVECGAAAGYVDEMIRFEGATAALRNCTFRASRMHGMTFLGSNPIIEDCQFLNNGFTNANAFAMAMRVDSWPRLANNRAQGNGNDAISVFDYHVTRSGTWLKDNLPYTLVNDVYVDAGATLTLEPGLVVQFRYPDTALVVDGTLTARGTALRPIRFTSDELQKAPGQWEAIIFRASNVNSILENCVVEYGAAAGLSDESIRFENATATIRNCAIRNSRLDGIRFQASDPVIENCQFVNNGTTNNGFAMAMRVDSLPKLKNNIALGNGRDAIKVFDYNFGRNGTWVKDSLPYTLVNDVNVNGGKSLTIEAGVTVQFQDPNVGLWVDGVLIARGTAAAPIAFTSDEAVKKAGQWRALTFRAPDGNSILENCNVEYGGANAEGNVALFGSSPRINNCIIHDSVSDAIHCNNSASLITASRIVKSGRDGIRTANGASPVINNSTISGHAEFGVRNFDTARIINAKSNFWGDPSGPFDNANTDGRNQLNASGKGDKVSEYVDWSAFLQTDALASQPPQKVEVSPTTLDFGTVIVGESKELFLGVRNVGGSELTVTSVASDSSRFRVVSPATPFTVAAGLQQAISVSFSADAITSATGTLTVRCNDASQSSVNISLKATGIVAADCLAPPSGLVGWWPGDGSFLNAASTNHGQPLGGVSFASGKIGRAFSFASDSDRITVPHDPLLDVQAPGFTVEFWMRGTKNQPHDQFLVVDKSHGWADSTGWMCQGYSGNGKIYFGIGAGGGGIVNFPGVVSATDVLDGVFHHVAGTWDGGTIRLYVDSALQGEAALSAPANNTRPVNLGYSWGGGSPNRFFRGQVDELAIYRRALSTNEIQAIFAADSAGKCKQAVTAPSIAVAPSSLDFGSVIVGQSKDLTFTISNKGNAPLTVRAITSDNARFVIASPVTPLTVGAGANATVNVRFTSSAPLAQKGIVTIVSSDPDQPSLTVTMTGNGVTELGGLIAYLPFNGNANDESGSGHNGIVNGATLTTDRFGQPNRAYQFDGKTQFIELADSKSLNFSTGGFTLSAWIAYTESGWAGHIISKHFSYAGAENGYFLALGSNAVAFFMNSLMWLGTTETYNDGRWHQTTAVYDGATMFLYVDGVLKDSQARGSPKANDMSITIGKATDAGYFTGKIDDVRIYSRPLSGAEVSTLYDTEFAADCVEPPAGLVGWWPGEGSFLNVAATNHGVPLGGVSFASGKVGLAFSFANDSDRITIPHDPLFDMQAPGFTSEFWMKGAKNQPQDHYLVVDKSHGWVDSTGWFFQGFSSSGRIAFAIGLGGGGDRNYPEVTSTIDVSDGVFHHVAGTWDGSTIRLYVDGALQGEAALSTPANNTRPVNLGYSWGGGSPNRFFRGQVDELSIYRRALTVSEVQTLSNAGAAGKCKQAAAAPVVALFPVSLDYGSVAVGQTKDLALAIRNSGTATLTVSSITSDDSRFTVISPATPFNLAGGTEQVVLVRFAPAIAGLQSGRLSVNSNDPAQAKVTVTVSGTGTAAPSTPPKLTVVHGDNQILVSWPTGAGQVIIQATESLLSPIQWSTLTNQPVVAGGQNTITIPTAPRADATMFFRALIAGGTPAPSSLGASAGNVSDALAALGQIPASGTSQEFQERVNRQLALLQSALDAFDSTLSGVAAQTEAAATNLGFALQSTAASPEPTSAPVALAGLRPQNSGFVPGPLTDVINQFKQVKQTVDELKKLKKKFNDGSDLLNLITQNKSLDEIASARSGFFKQISDVFKKMRDDVEGPLAEMIAGKNQGKPDDADDFQALVAFVTASDPLLGSRMSSPQFTIDSYRNLNLTDRQKDLVAQAFRSSTIRGRLYLRDNLLGFLSSLASAGVETYVSTIIDATGGKGVKSALELAKKVYDFLTKNAAVPQTTLKFASRRRFLRTDDPASDVKADLFLLAKLPDGSTRLATFLVNGKNVINERYDILLTQGLQVPALAYDILLVPRDQENEPIKLLPLAASVDANLSTFVDLPLVFATKTTVNLAAKQRDAAGGLSDATLTLDQRKSLAVRVEGFSQAADGPMGAVFDTELLPDGTTRGFFVIPFLPPNLPLSLRITGPDTEDLQQSLTVTQPESQVPVTLILKPVAPQTWLVPVIAWKLSTYSGDLVITNAAGPTISNAISGTLFSPQGRTNVNTTLSGTLQISPLVRNQDFDVVYTLVRQVQSPIPGVKSVSSISLRTTQYTAPVSSSVVPANPESISLKLAFRSIPQVSLYKIDVTADPGFAGFGPGVTFFPADAFGGYGGNFSMFGDNSGVSFGNGKISLGGTVFVGSDLSNFNPSYRLDVTVTFRSP